VSVSEWIVAITGAALIALELWFFLGSAPSNRRGTP
jgi:plastocyanin domain-containing protein